MNHFLGSLIKGGFSRLSDVDVAVFCREPLSGRTYMRILEALESLPLLREVDIIDLWRVSSADFLEKVLKEGLIWRSSEELMKTLKERLEGLRRSEARAS